MDMKLFYGTTNASKFRHMQTILADLPIQLVSPAELGLSLPAVEENGATPLENAEKKALAYWKASGMACLGLDSGLYIQGLPDDLQPGLFVRRVGGKELTDEEFICHYSALARQMGGRAKARFVNGLCAVDKDGQIKRAMGPGISTDWFWIVEKPHPLRVEGFPMDSIAVYPGTSRYWVEGDLEDAQQAKGVGPVEGFRRFFTEFAAGDYRPHLEELIWTTTK